ncbi:site-specific integrase [Pseudomonas sp. M5]|uniref:site-specific integrase n=1 Tax=Pseudomonas sp. M5 TaxID=1620788 RepID=UPI0019585CF3|nr:site-specific integrase [Pseudomonas sp. M5]MBM7396789.1 integrase [Pseudomonas sp. M5]HDS1756044.1 site-specific integrase [Pseudomonas putida]
MTFTLKTYIGQRGERFSLLFSSEDPGAPLFYPCAFISRRVRDTSTHQTQTTTLKGIQRLIEWERDRKVCLEEKLSRGVTLAPFEIDDLAGHVRGCRTAKKGEVISSQKFNGYWSSICKYIDWLTDELLPNRNSPHMRMLVEEQSRQLNSKTRKQTASRARQNQKILSTNISSTERTQLLILFESSLDSHHSAHLRHDSHAKKGVQLRNIVMLRILYETGMRRGELLSLKLKNFVEASGGEGAYLSIERNHDDEFDRRANQPVAKTLGRDVAISEDLESQIMKYITQYRAELNNVGLNPDSFIFCVHRSGKTQGTPITVNGFNSALNQLKNKHPALGKCQPHAFRHDWNYRFSQKADDLGMSETEEIEAREQQMGWVPASSMAKVYNQRHRREKALNLARKIAEDTKRPNK